MNRKVYLVYDTYYIRTQQWKDVFRNIEFLILIVMALSHWWIYWKRVKSTILESCPTSTLKTTFTRRWSLQWESSAVSTDPIPVFVYRQIKHQPWSVIDENLQKVHLSISPCLSVRLSGCSSNWRTSNYVWRGKTNKMQQLDVYY